MADDATGEESKATLIQREDGVAVADSARQLWCGCSERTRTTVVDVIYVGIYLGLNLVLNLYNKWAFSVLQLRVPLLTLFLHQTFIFVGLSVMQWMYMCNLGRRGSCGFKPTPFAAEVSGGSRVGHIATLAISTAANYGMNIVALMLLAQADNQVIRATIPMFCILTTFVFERKSMQLSQMLLASVTVAGSVLTIVAHASKWKLNVVGLVLCVVSNLAAAIMMSFAAIFKRKFNMNSVDVTWYLSAPVALTILPFVFFTGEHKIFSNFMRGIGADGEPLKHAQPFEAIMFLLFGSLAALVYSIVHFEIIQRTTSVFVSIVGNFKMALVIILSEAIVQNTHLPPASYAGIAIVTVAFIGSWVKRELAKRGRDSCDAEIPPCCPPEGVRRKANGSKVV